MEDLVLAQGGYTVDIASFEECFGPQAFHSDEADDDDTTDRRETADPGKLRALLEGCRIEEEEDDQEEEEEDVTAASPPKVVVCRRMTCDARLLRESHETDRKRRNTLALSSVPEESEEPTVPTVPEETDEFPGRPSMSWTLDETRSTMEELRRQLQVERDVATDAERDRDDLTKEIQALQDEIAARVELVRSLEEQRDVATARAATAEAKAQRCEAEAARAAGAEAAARAAAAAHVADANRRAETALAQVAMLRKTNEALQDRVDTLNKVKITKDFAARVRALKEDRDRLKRDLDEINDGAAAAAAWRRRGDKENEDPFSYGDHYPDRYTDDCKQS